MSHVSREQPIKLSLNDNHVLGTILEQPKKTWTYSDK